jgi:hypothetical protein
LGAGGSTWSDVEGWANVGEDVLYQLGKQSPSMRIDMGARSGIIDDLCVSRPRCAAAAQKRASPAVRCISARLTRVPAARFVGKFMGQQADIASGALRMYERRTLAHLCGDYAIPPRFMDAVTLHLVKNFLAESGQLSHGVPLILGIWGAKGCGKSFNVELVCKKMGVQPIIMSSGELEDEYAVRACVVATAALRCGCCNLRADLAFLHCCRVSRGGASASGTAWRARRFATAASCRVSSSTTWTQAAAASATRR